MRFQVIFFIVLSVFSVSAFCQQSDTLQKRKNSYVIETGAGWTHYFNNLEYGDKNIKTDFAGVSMRLFWEPEYRLSLGIESGYYRLFKVEGNLDSGMPFEVDRDVIPIMLLARMRIAGNLFLGTGFGLALIKNKSLVENEMIKTNTLSLSNYELSAAYIYPLNSHLKIGGEMKVYNYGSLNDWLYSLQLFGVVRF
jgi:hypothetical protein